MLKLLVSVIFVLLTALDSLASVTVGSVTSGGYWTLAFPFQNCSWYNGKFYQVLFYDNNGTTAAALKTAYAASDLVFGTKHAVPFIGTVIRGYYADSFYGLRESYGFTGLASTAGGTGGTAIMSYKDDDSLNNTKSTLDGIFQNSTLGFSAGNPISTIADHNDYVWVAGMTFSAPNFSTKVKRASNASGEIDVFDAFTTLGAVNTNGSRGVQLIPFQNGDIQLVYSIGAALYSNYWVQATATWGSQEVILDASTSTNSLESFYTYRAAPYRTNFVDNKTMLIYVAAVDRTLRVKIRTAGSGGTWGTVITTISDLDTTVDNQFYTSTGDMGKQNSAYIFYVDSTGNVVYRTWNDSVISAKTTLQAGPLSIVAGGDMCAPLFESASIPVAWNTTTTVQMQKLDLTPNVETSDGVLVTDDGHTQEATGELAVHMVSRNGISLLFYASRGQESVGRLYNHTTQSFLGAGFTVLSTKRYWDIGHDDPDMAIGNSGNVYMVEGGYVGYNSTSPVKIYKSKKLLDDATWTLTNVLDVTANGWDDITPPTIVPSNRGYKQLFVDNNDVPQLIHEYDNGKARILERRAGVWSSNVVLINLSNVNYKLYVPAAVLGQEAVGQKSLHVIYTFSDTSLQPAITEGTILQLKVFYAKVVPNGDGTYSAFKADGTPITLPLTESNGDLVYDGSVGAGTCAANANCWIRYGGGVGVIDEGGGVLRPAFTFLKCDKTAPYNVQKHVFMKWNGTNWTTVSATLQTSGFPFQYYPDLIKNGTTTLVVGNQLISGVNQLVTYRSYDNGVTWGSAVQLTTNNYSNMKARLTLRSPNTYNLIWHARIAKTHAEVRFTTFTFTLSGLTYGLIDALGKTLVQ